MLFFTFFFVTANLIAVPSELPFSSDVSSCRRLEFGPAACPRHLMIGVDEVIASAIQIVENELPKRTDAAGSYRVPPLMISRLARGGKTTTLCLLFDELKRKGMHPIFITFNGSANFQLRNGESQCATILRLIASQLVNIGVQESQRLVCDESALDNYIGNEPFVLLIDELNALAAPVDAEAGSLLRRLFLDKENRYLVFTTHVPIDIEQKAHHAMASSSNPPSPRGFKTVPLSPCLDLGALQAMSSLLPR
jgi:hypothetical protein